MCGFVHLRRLRLYPTFEEWKLINLPSVCDAIQLFISYLWGMKTFLKSSTAPVSNRVYILPLRNENSGTPWLASRTCFSLYPTFEEWKHNVIVDIHIRFTSLYPTFEEWKQKYKDQEQATLAVVYILPLRNENRSTSICTGIHLQCLYPTFEEWKRFCSPVAVVSDSAFISYLWGMKTTTQQLRHGAVRSVYILPLRNENLFIFYWTFISSP